MEVGLWYAVAEYAFYLVAMVIRSHRVMLLQQWRGTVVLFGSYLVLGALAGFAAALLIRRPDPEGYRTRKVSILAVTLLFAANVVFASGGTNINDIWMRVCIAAACLVVGAVISFDIGVVKGQFNLVRAPALTFGILILGAWATCNVLGLLPLWLRVPAIVALVGMSLAGVIVTGRLLGRLMAQYTWLARTAAAVKIAVLVALILGPEVVSSRAESKTPVWPSAKVTHGTNVVLMTLDTVGARHLGIYGYSRQNTPHLRALLDQSTLYTRCVAVAPITLTSHASIFTGLYPQSTGAYKGFSRFETGRPLADNIPTLAEVLDRAGYRTMAVAANRFYLSDEFGTLRGFRFVDWFGPTVLVTPERGYLLRNRLRDLLRFAEIPRDFDATTVPAETVNRRVSELLAQNRRSSAPFLLFANYMDAHAPYIPPAPYNSMYPGRDLGYNLTSYATTGIRVNGGNLPILPASRAHLISQYDGAIAYLDEKVGELLDTLKQNGEFDRTMIVITSDHGESFGEKNLVTHDTSIYEDQVHVPLIIKYPGQTHAERVDTLASHVDLMPTILGVLGVQSPSPMQGIDLRNAASVPDRVVVAEMHGSVMWSTPRFKKIEWALYSGTKKMIYSDKGNRELYDLSNDPQELHNLYRADAPEVAQLRARLIDWSRHTLPLFQDSIEANRAVDKRLESLGYAHGGVD